MPKFSWHKDKYERLEGIITTYDNGDELFDVIVSGCDKAVGLTIEILNSAGEPTRRYAVCLNGPSSPYWHTQHRRSRDSYHELFEHICGLLRSGIPLKGDALIRRRIRILGELAIEVDGTSNITTCAFSA